MGIGLASNTVEFCIGCIEISECGLRIHSVIASYSQIRSRCCFPLKQQPLIGKRYGARMTLELICVWKLQITLSEYEVDGAAAVLPNQ